MEDKLATHRSHKTDLMSQSPDDIHRCHDSEYAQKFPFQLERIATNCMIPSGKIAFLIMFRYTIIYLLKMVSYTLNPDSF